MKCPNCRGRMRYDKAGDRFKTMPDGSKIRLRVWVCIDCDNAVEIDTPDQPKPYRPAMRYK